MYKLNELHQANCENVKTYVLINNDGYTFSKNGKNYDLRHVLNVYGVEVDLYELIAKNDDGSYFFKTFDTFYKALNFIKAL